MGRSTTRPSSNRATANGDASAPIQTSHLTSHLTERIVFLSGEINETAIAQTIAGIVVLANQDPISPITLLVSTYGGSLDEMFSLYDVMKYVPCPIHTVGLGKVMSAGILILAAGQRGRRFAGNSARLMMHPLSAGVEGNIFQLKNDVNEWSRQQSMLESLLSRETSMGRSQIAKLMKRGHDAYITPQEAVKFGIVDAIIEPKER